ncbi:hypothetical protein QBC47DRAFT_403195 [Echria macrotheca]|uniref:Nephrocystin 3-like N-terminal domain-containing protein n=1 Tax=Echria macrotheca TaxID=438768 RepID=A0AAJ0BAR0_9PEZI|nr:hypothetical protein QBC47DRAFT_403195 [Echria macrotheca]
MDPVSIIGLTSSIITFIDAGSKFITLAKGIYNSPTGQVEELDRIEQFSVELEDISNHLASSCPSTPQTSAQRSLVAASKDCAGTCREMLELIDQCTAWRNAKTLAEDACDACNGKEKALRDDDTLIVAKKQANVNKLRKAGPRQECQCQPARPHQKRSALGSIALAAKFTFKKSEIDGLQKRLDSARRLLELASLSAMRSARTFLKRRPLRIRISAHTMFPGKREETQRSLVLLQGIGFRQLSELKAIQAWVSRLETYNSDKNEANASKNLETALRACIGAGSAAQLFQAYLKELEFPVRTVRFSSVLDAHPSTFEYMFEKDSKLFESHPALKLSFRDWLSNGEGVFHIAGKPGSGKSTLMKYLVQDARTRSFLQEWSGKTNQLVLASFFFWKPGHPLQKSTRGLVRSLLHTVLSKCPDLFEQLLGSLDRDQRELQFGSASYTGSVTLSERDIQGAFNCLVSNKAQSNRHGPRFCFFIDGLDEFEDPQEDYSDLVVRLKDWSNAMPGRVKLCVSSRELPIFHDIEPGQRVHLHLLTQGDIRKFVMDRLTGLPGSKKSKCGRTLAATEYDALVQEIVTKAEGVFLWVYLVTRTLRKGLLENGDSINMLRKKLEHLPSELDDFFRHMLDSIELIYRHEAYSTLAVALRMADSESGGWPLFRYGLLFLFFENPDFATYLPDNIPRPSELDAQLEAARRKLNARWALTSGQAWIGIGSGGGDRLGATNILKLPVPQLCVNSTRLTTAGTAVAHHMYPTQSSKRGIMTLMLLALAKKSSLRESVHRASLPRGTLGRLLDQKDKAARERVLLLD